MNKKKELQRALDKVYKKLYAHEKNLKVWEMELRKTIEGVYGKPWDQVTDSNIYLSLLGIGPKLTITCILNSIKTEV